MSKSAPSAEKSDNLLPPLAVRQSPPKRRLSMSFYLLLAAVCTGIAPFLLGHDLISRCMSQHGDATPEELCPQPSPLAPSINAGLWKALNDKFGSKEFVGEAVELLGGAVRIP